MLTIKFVKNNLILLLIASSLVGCLSKDIVQQLPKPLRQPMAQTNEEVVNVIENNSELLQEKSRERFVNSPRVPKERRFVAGLNTIKVKKILLQGEKSQINIENLAIPDFINEIFGNVLGLSFKIASGIDKQKDLVTLRFTEPETPEAIYQAAIVILADYGVQVLKKDKLLHFSYSNKTPVGEPPLLVSGRTLPSVPASHRPIFQLVTLHSVRNRDVRGWLTQLYKKHGLTVTDDAISNAVVLQGPPELVAQAVEAIKVLDQPSMNSRHSIKINALYQPARSLAKGLLQILKAEGYAASDTPGGGSIMVLPIETSNAVFVFSANEVVLEHIKEWAESIDQPVLNNSEQSFFYYKVQNVDAEGIVESLGELTLSLITNIKNEQSKKLAKQQNPSKARLQVDKGRNAVMFYGKAEEWMGLLPIIKQMDIPPRQVLVEVTVAEITLTDDEKFGIEWIFEQASGELSSVLKMLGGAGLASSTGGLSYIVSSAGNTRMVLNALASTDKVSILSTPRILVKSGEEASIQVGTDIPIITSQSSAADITNNSQEPSILQNVQYRKTGTILNVKPIVYAGRRVDIEISQEISAAQDTVGGGVNSPSILSRKVETSLSLQDGHSILLAGLINNNITQNQTGIPYLMDIPYLGLLFSRVSETKTRTEIVILITPYVIDDYSEIIEITKEVINKTQFNKGLELMK